MKQTDQLLSLNVIAALLVLGAFSDGASADPTGEESAQLPDVLVNADWLKEHLDDPDLVVLDATVMVEPDGSGNVRVVNGRANFESGHIPSAGFADLMGNLSDQDGPLQFGMPSPQQFAVAMEELGVGDGSRVVLYDAMGSSWAARVWWMLRWIGFDRAALLDGGLAAWTAAGGELSTESVQRTPGTLTVKLRPEIIADEDEVRASIDDDAIRLVDALPAIHYRGEFTMYGRPGHIPGADNIPVTSLVDETGHFLSTDELAERIDGDTARRTITRGCRRLRGLP